MVVDLAETLERNEPILQTGDCSSVSSRLEFQNGFDPEEPQVERLSQGLR